MPHPLLIVTSVPAEAEALGGIDGVTVLVSGIGRTNAAAATAEALTTGSGSGRTFQAVMSAGVAGVLPDGGLSVGELIVATSCVYAEEGMMWPEGFADIRSLGLVLGDFEGNVVPVDEGLLAALRSRFRTGPIATVATCSGTDESAAEVQRRTGAIAEAMEGAAVVHAARRLKVPAIELRVISNTTGDRANQVWDLRGALAALGRGAREAAAVLGG